MIELIVPQSGEIVLSPFPYSNINLQRWRPSLVVSNAEFNRATGQCWLLMITTAQNSRWHSDIAIDGLAEIGLQQPSVIRMKFHTLDYLALGKTIGKLPAALMSQIKDAMHNIIR